MMTKAVAYYRVSTPKQGESGLGLDAQRTAVEAFCASRGFTLIAPPFQEVESGKRDDRPELMKALERCKITGATLIVAKLDRLSRNVAFLATLQDSSVKFIAVDMPEANELTVHIMAAVAQQERKAISTRTKEALAAAKARGTRLGNPNGAAALQRFGAGKASPLGTAAIKAKADEHAQRLRPIVEQIRKAGHVSLPSIANALNAEGILTPRGRQWHPSSVSNLLVRLNALQSA
jgi:DNA invertase Pin-like site-specific DNA recombinase